ncbi:Crp/Fnr family transcriptional regulator [Tsuneonella mangrovi]|uniref:Crp/Fnr family transcriptional regulator n=1 Tax=Tsuneonella mangrovi TaxID=1982042 RepID=UPI000BA27478|nr:Crp/Fnr family transcriptional regulator [Tsuneonella mangrovi]
MSNIEHSSDKAAPSPPLRSLLAAMMFEALAPDIQVQLRAGSPSQLFSDGQLIHQRGTESEGFCLIEEGTVSVGQFLRSGEFRSVALLGPGDSYGELAILANRPRIVDSLARGPARVRFIGSALFERVLAENPSAMRALLGGMAAQLQETLDLLAGMRSGTSFARTAGLLANLAGGGSEPRTVGVTQQEIADLLGVTRATANAALKTLEAQGLIARSYGVIEVFEPARLTLLAMT